VYAFAVPIRLQGIGNEVHANTIDAVGCKQSGATNSVALHYGAASSSANVGSFTITNNVITGAAANHTNDLFGQAHDSTAALSDVTLVGNANSIPSGAAAALILGTPNCSSVTEPNHATLCYQYGNTGLAGVVTCGSSTTGWQLENIVAGCSSSAQSANLGATALYTPAGTKAVVVTCQILLTRAATTSSTLPQCVISYTDVFTNAAESITITAAWASGTLGCSGSTTNTVGNACQGNTAVIAPKAATAVNYSTVNYASAGGTTMQYQAFVRAVTQ
jgi:hypothetical protein